MREKVIFRTATTLTQSGESEPFIVADVTTAMVDRGRALAVIRATGKAVLTDQRQLKLAARCNRPDTLTGHARRLAAELGVPDAVAPELLRRLETLAAQGLLRRLPAATGAPAPAAPITHLAIPTRNRPEALAPLPTQPRRPLPAARSDPGLCRARLVHRRRRGGGNAGNLPAERRRSRNPRGLRSTADKRAFARRLASTAGLPDELVEFALTDTYACGNDTGSNRNALLMAHVDRLWLSADDDVICQPRMAGRSPGVVFSAVTEPTEVRVFASLEAAREPRSRWTDACWKRTSGCWATNCRS